jgi:hypothetical protein
VRKWRKVETAAKVEPVGEFALKGIRRPLAAPNTTAIAAAFIYPTVGLRRRGGQLDRLYDRGIIVLGVKLLPQLADSDSRCNVARPAAWREARRLISLK